MQSQGRGDIHDHRRKAQNLIVTRSDFLGVLAMSASLLQLMDELLQAIEQRDAGDPDAPAWEACARIERLEEEIAQRLSAASADRSTIPPVGVGRPVEAAAVIA